MDVSGWKRSAGPRFGRSLMRLAAGLCVLSCAAFVQPARSAQSLPVVRIDAVNPYTGDTVQVTGVSGTLTEKGNFKRSGPWPHVNYAESETVWKSLIGKYAFIFVLAHGGKDPAKDSQYSKFKFGPRLELPRRYDFETPTYIRAVSVKGVKPSPTPKPARPVIIAPAGAHQGRVDQYTSFWIEATNNPTSFGASGLPPGFSIDPSSGLIDGTPTARGTWTIRVSATNAGGTGTGTFTLTVECSPAVIADLEKQRDLRQQSVQSGNWHFDLDNGHAGYFALPGSYESDVITNNITQKWFTPKDFKLIGGLDALGSEGRAAYKPVFLAQTVEVVDGPIPAAFLPGGIYGQLKGLLVDAGFEDIPTSGRLLISFSDWKLEACRHREAAINTQEIIYSTTVRIEIEGLPVSATKACEVVYLYAETQAPFVVNGIASYAKTGGLLPRPRLNLGTYLRTKDRQGFNNWTVSRDPGDYQELAAFLNGRFAGYSAAWNASHPDSGFSGYFYRVPTVLFTVAQGAAATRANYFTGGCSPEIAAAERAMDAGCLPELESQVFFSQAIHLQVPVAGFQRVMALFGDLDFGYVPLRESKTRQLVIHNWGNVPLDVAGIELPNPAFHAAFEGTVPPNGSVTVDVTFTPTKTGEERARLLVDSNSTGAQVARLVRGYCTPSGYSAVSPQSLHLPASGGVFHVDVATVSNWSSLDLGTPWLSVDGQTRTGVGRAEVVVSENKGAASRSSPIRVAGVMVNISQSGTASPAAVLLEGDLDFGIVPLGTYVDQVVSISNPGSAPLEVSAIECPDGFSTDWNGGTVSPGQSRHVTVTFRPMERRAYPGSVVVRSNAPDGAASLECKGEGSGEPSAEIAVMHSGGIHLASGVPAPLFGPVPVSGGVLSRTFTIENIGTAPLTLWEATKTGDGAGLYFLDASGLDSILNPGERTRIRVEFAPALLGTHAAGVRIGSSDEDENPFDLLISGWVIDPRDLVQPKAPKVSSPPRAVTARAAYKLTGNAGDVSTGTYVEYQVGGGRKLKASIKRNGKFVIKTRLANGRNLIKIRTVNAFGMKSKIMKIRVDRRRL